MALRQLEELRYIGRPDGHLVVDCGEERGRLRADTGDLEHQTASLPEAEAMHGAAGDLHESANRADDVLAAALKVHLASQDIESFIPAMAMRRRASSFVTLLHRDSDALGRRVRRQHRNLHSDDIQRVRKLAGPQDKIVYAHDVAAPVGWLADYTYAIMRLKTRYKTFVSLLAMQNMKSRPPPRAMDPEGRVNQKRRTRQALIDAARALRDEHRNPTFAEVAERAMVSRATAYRYFPSIEALISETATDRGMKPLDRFWRPGDDPVEGAGSAANELHALLLADEIGLHVMERSFMTVWLESNSREIAPRPGRRMSYIEPIVDSLKDVLSPAARRRLKHALSTVMGTEALIAVRDISGASIDDALDATAWAARSLVRQALAEAAPAHGKRSVRVAG